MYIRKEAKHFAAQDTTIKITKDDLHLKGAPDTIDGTTVGNILGVVYFIAGIVAVLMIVIGGIRFVGANGDSNQVQAGKETVTYAVIGLIVVIMAAAITQFIIQNVAK
ncbi:hypothetical protein KC953_01255 [Candidatus Saccharibacteria bacterium]|nr:hypothetical protein [Candidatus Saccharibacteria bacterium]